MTKFFCDCCKKEIIGTVYKFEVFIHIEDIAEGRDVQEWSVYPNGELCSHRTVIYDLDLACYDKIMMTAYLKYSELEKANGQSTNY